MNEPSKVFVARGGVAELTPTILTAGTEGRLPVLYIASSRAPLGRVGDDSTLLPGDTAGHPLLVHSAGRFGRRMSPPLGGDLVQDRGRFDRSRTGLNRLNGYN